MARTNEETKTHRDVLQRTGVAEGFEAWIPYLTTGQGHAGRFQLLGTHHHLHELPACTPSIQSTQHSERLQRFRS